MTEPPKSKPYHLSLKDCAVSVETCPPQPVRGLDLQSLPANPHRSCFAGTNQPSNSLVSLPDCILARDRGFIYVAAHELTIPIAAQSIRRCAGRRNIGEETSAGA